MVQQRIDTRSITNPPTDGIADSVIIVSNDHIQGPPAVTLTCLAADVSFAADTFTIPSHGLTNDTAIHFRTTDTLPGGINDHVTYYVVAATPNDFKVSLTVGGAAEDILDAGLGTHYILTGMRFLAQDPWDSVLASLNLTALDLGASVPLTISQLTLGLATTISAAGVSIGTSFTENYLEITEVSAQIRRNGSPSFDLRAYVYDDSGVGPGSIIATSNVVDITTVTNLGSGEQVSFTFASPVILTPGLRYFFFIDMENIITLNVGNSYTVYRGTGAGTDYLNGSRWTSVNSRVTFSESATTDFTFTITGSALSSTNVIGALDGSISPSTINPIVTRSYLLDNIAGKKNFVLIGPSGSGADFEGNNETPFNQAITFLQARDGTTDGGWLVVLPGTYTFSTTLLVPLGIRIEGIHPDLVTLQRTLGNLAVIEMQGNNSSLRNVKIENTSATTKAALVVSGQQCSVEACIITNFNFVGLQLGGNRNKVEACRFDSSLATNVGVLVQNSSNNLNRCSFIGTHPNGALQIEGSNCGIYSSYFASTLVGFSYRLGFPSMTLPNPSVNNNRVVGNHFASASSLALSSDSGTASVRYANTPNSLEANQNNFLEPLATFVGQPTISTENAVLTQPFSGNPLGGPFSSTSVESDSITEFLDHPNPAMPSLDLFVQRSYEERNFFLHSDDPVFNPDGSPSSGVFSWDGSQISYPQFYIRSIFARNARWSILAGIETLNPGDVLFVEIDQSLSGVDVILTPQVLPYPLVMNHSDGADAPYRMVLAVGMSGNLALWLQGFRLLNNLTSFDVDGTPLPMVRFIGPSEIRNPTPPFSGFSGAAQSNLTAKLSSQSAHLRRLFERSNLTFEPLSNNAEFNTEPTPGDWITGTDITSGIPNTPTHLIEIKTQTYGLDPTTGLYRYNLSGAGWTPIPGNPLAAPFTAMSTFGSGIAILSVSGQISHYDPNTATWSSPYSPILSDKVSSLVPFPSSRSLGFVVGGQADYSLQTENHTFFTTLSGDTVRFSLAANTLEWSPRAFTETPGYYGLISHSLKDTGYNSLRNPDDLFESLDNGCSFTTGLPLGVKGKFVPEFDHLYDEFRDTDFSSLEVENFSFDDHSGAFMSIYTDGSKWYVVGGGKNKAVLYDVLEASDFVNFEPHFWAVDGARQEVVCLGRSLYTSSFSVKRGYIEPSTGKWFWVNQTPLQLNVDVDASDVDDTTNLFNSLSHGFENDQQVMFETTGTLPGGIASATVYYIVNTAPNTFQVSLTSGGLAIDLLDQGTGVHTVKTAQTCSGAIGVYDHYPNGLNAGDLWVIVSNPSKANRPSFWKRDGISGSWSFVNLTDTPIHTNDVLVNNVTSNTFDYVRSVDPLSGYGVASPRGISFLVRNKSATSRPVLFHFDRNSMTYFVRKLSNAPGVGESLLTFATANSAVQCYGAGYHHGTHSDFWIFKSSGSVVTLFSLHEDGVDLTSWSSFQVAPSGLTLPFTNRSSSQFAANNYTDDYFPNNAARTLFLLTEAGLSTLNILGTSTALSLTSLVHDDHVTTNVPCFSSNKNSPYLPLLGNSRGGEPSIQIGSWILDSGSYILPVQGASFGLDPDLGGGIFWSEPGTVVKNAGKNLWVGLNRSGYLWVGNALIAPRMTELKPNNPAIRGDVIIANLSSTDDFDCAANADGSLLAIVFKDPSNLDRLAFLLYNTVAHTFSLERSTFGAMNYVGSDFGLVTSPKIVFNTALNTWDITYQDSGRTGKTMFVRRSAAVWVLAEFLGLGSDPIIGTKPLASMTDNAGLNPSRALPMANGDIMVATQNTAAGNLLVIYRDQATGNWSTAASIAGGGFVKPEVGMSSSTFWVLGSNDTTIARVASSAAYTTGWAPFTVPAATTYNRMLETKVYSTSTGVIVASPLKQSGAINDNEEFGIFKFKNSGVVKGQIFSAKGRLQSALWSGEEESDYANHSWTPDGKLLYSAVRPGRDPHWSVKVSRNIWDGIGDSCLGSGRLITIGKRTYREEYCDVGQSLISEYSLNHQYIRDWDNLPLAERDVGQFTSLRYPVTADVGVSSLFNTGNPSSFTADTSLQSGSLMAVTAREFPLICGKTRIQGGVGANVLYQGGMLVLQAPPASTTMSYFGASDVGEDGMFKLTPQDTLTIKGTWIFRALNDNTRTYTITGPLSFNLDASVNGHLVLNFPTAFTLQLDATSTPLTYWTTLNHPEDTYAIVLGELRDKFFALYPSVSMDSRIVKLTLGSLELPDIIEAQHLISYCAPVSQLAINRVISERFYINPLDIDSVSVKQVGTLNGFQRLDFPLIDGENHLLVAQGLPPQSTGYFFYENTTNAVEAEQDGLRIKHVVGRFGNLVVFDSY